MAQNFIGCERDQVFLLPPDPREWLPEDHLAWTVLSADGTKRMAPGTTKPYRPHSKLMPN